MIRVHVRRGVLGEDRAETVELEHRAQTARELVDAFRRPEWTGLEVGVAVDGAVRSGDELDLALEDGVDVVIGPAPGATVGGFILSAVISAIISVGISYAIAALTPKPRRPGDVVQRGDEGSQTYAWSGIATTTGQGVTMPVVLGQHDVGGHVIYSDVDVEEDAGVVTETLRVALALSEGPIYAIGGQTADADALGAAGGGDLPTGIRVGDNVLPTENPTASAWTRRGTLGQSPLPAPFAGTSTTEIVQEIIEELTYVYVTLDTTQQIASVSFVVGFPSGLYIYGPNGPIATGRSFSPEWRIAGTNDPWRRFVDERGNPANVSVAPPNPVFGQYSAARTLFPDVPNVVGPIEVRVFNNSPRLGVDGVATAVLRSLIYTTPHRFSYPRTAVLGLAVPADLQTAQSIDVQAPVSGQLVRVWDPVNGWSEEAWTSPAAPWNYYTFDVGRNPAWLLVRFLLAEWGLGKWVSEANLDLESFARWAVYCDQRPGPGGEEWSEPRFRCDLVLDRPSPSWETAQRIAATGAAVLFWRGNRIAVAYRYQRAHSKGPISVPAKFRTQMFSAPLLRDVNVRWLPTRDRPRIYEYAFLDAEKAYAQDRFRVSDPTATFDDPTAFEQDPDRVEQIDAFGVTRRTQLFRMGWFEHALARLVRKEITFEVPHQAIAAEIGDVVGVQTDILRPFSTESLGMTIAVGGMAVTEIAVDQALELAAATSYRIILRDPDGGVQEAAIASPAGSYAAGAPITLATAVDCDAGAAVAIGVVDAIVEDFEIVSLTLERDLRRRVQALQWVPECYDEPAESDMLGTGGGASPSESGGPLLEQSTTFEELVRVDPTAITIQPDPGDPGRHVIAFARPQARRNALARVYVRLASAAAWIVAGETRLDSIRLQGVAAWQTISVAVVFQQRRGGWPAPTAADAAALAVPEPAPLPPPDVPRAELLEHPDGILVTWDRLDSPLVDDYEVRRGTSWHEGEILGRTAGARLLDRAPRFHLGDTYWIAARSRFGVHSVQPANAQTGQVAFPWTPPGTETLAASGSYVSSSPSGTLSSMSWAADDLQVGTEGFRHDGIELAGSYEAPELVLRDDDATEYEVAAWWTVLPTFALVSLETLADWTWRANSREARARSIWYRPPTPARRGIGRRSIAELLSPRTIESLLAGSPTVYASGLYAGELGERWYCELESRFYVGGAWSAWQPHRDGLRVASRIQVRATLQRADPTFRLYLTGLLVTGHV